MDYNMNKMNGNQACKIVTYFIYLDKKFNKRLQVLRCIYNWS